MKAWNNNDAAKKYPFLFSPFQLGRVYLKNRIVYPPVSTCYAGEDGTLTERTLKFYTARAQGGVAAVIVEAAIISPEGKLAPFSLGIWEDRFVSDFSRLAETISVNGAVPFLQLAHAGSRTSKLIAGSPVAPSPISLKKASGPPHPLTREEIKSLVNKFIQSALRAEKAGFAGVELYCAHFYLLSAFLSSVTNKRVDEYGRNIKGKTRIVKEIIEGIKEKKLQAFSCFAE